MYKDGESCGICLEDLKDIDEIKRTNCGHYFCSPCLDVWMERSKIPTCPMDREDISVKSITLILRCKECKEHMIDGDIEHIQSHFGEWSDFKPWDDNREYNYIKDTEDIPEWKLESEKISWYFKQPQTLRILCEGKYHKSTLYSIVIINPTILGTL